MSLLSKLTRLDGSSCPCPNCGRSIPTVDINVTADSALCRECGMAYPFSELIHGGAATTEIDLSHPPPGTMRHREGGRTVVSASTRSPLALLLIPFTCVWCSISVGGIYGNQLRRGVFDPVTSLFGIPFLLAAFVLVTQSLMTSLGRVTVIRDGDEGTVSVGTGLLAWKRRSWRAWASANLAEARHPD